MPKQDAAAPVRVAKVVHLSSRPTQKSKLLYSGLVFLLPLKITLSGNTSVQASFKTEQSMVEKGKAVKVSRGWVGIEVSLHLQPPPLVLLLLQGLSLSQNRETTSSYGVLLNSFW